MSHSSGFVYFLMNAEQQNKQTKIGFTLETRTWSEAHSVIFLFVSEFVLPSLERFVRRHDATNGKQKFWLKTTKKKSQMNQKAANWVLAVAGRWAWDSSCSRCVLSIFNFENNFNINIKFSISSPRLASKVSPQQEIHNKCWEIVWVVSIVPTTNHRVK